MPRLICKFENGHFFGAGLQFKAGILDVTDAQLEKAKEDPGYGVEFALPEDAQWLSPSDRHRLSWEPVLPKKDELPEAFAKRAEENRLRFEKEQRQIAFEENEKRIANVHGAAGLTAEVKPEKPVAPEKGEEKKKEAEE